MPTSQSIKAMLESADYLDDEPVATVVATTTETKVILSQESTTEDAVEDAEEVTKASTATKLTPPTPASAPVKTAATRSVSTSAKRQLSLTDMFTPGASKKAKTSAGGAASGSGSTSTPPKAVSGLKSFNSIPFNMETYQASLSDEEKKLLHLECETMGRTWLKVLKDEIRKPYFLQLKRFLWKEGVQGPADASVGSPKIFPPPKDIYNWSRVSPLGKLKVVIIGQDPYHGPGQAHGLCFSVKKGVRTPPSLMNMYKEIKNDYPNFVPPKHGDLTNWAESGVLLINTSLTVRAGAAGSHSGKGWETFTDTVVDLIDKYGGATLTKEQGGLGRGVVFLAWGAWAAKRVAKLSKTKHLVLTSAHPSPLSAHKTPGFFGNAHFKKANDWLERRYGNEATVDWTKLD